MTKILQNEIFGNEFLVEHFRFSKKDLVALTIHLTAVLTVVATIAVMIH